MTDIKRSIMIKCEPQDKQHLNTLFETYKDHVAWTLDRIEEIHDEYEKTKTTKKPCDSCKETKELNYTNIKKEKICTSCFIRRWSEYTLFKNLKPSLMMYSKEKNAHLAHSGYYYGAISTAAKIFKSYTTKKNKRDYETARAKEKVVEIDGELNALIYDIKKTKAKITITGDLKITKELAKLEGKKEALEKNLKTNRKIAERKQVSFPVFRGDEIYFGKQRMFEIKPEQEGYAILISDYKIQRNKIRLDVKIGKTTKKHKTCKTVLTLKDGLLYCPKCDCPVPRDECTSNYQEKFINKCIEKKEHHIVYPKLIRRNDEFFFIFPAREQVSIKTKEEIKAWVKEDEDIDYCCLSFGVKTPVTLSIIKKGKIVMIKKFGNGSLYQKGEVDRRIRAKIFNSISEKYGHEHPHEEGDKRLHQKKRKSLLKANRKMGFRLQRFTNYYNQKLSHDVIKFIKENTDKSLIIYRDMKSVKDISYKGELIRTLTRWSVQQQTTFIEYKAFLNNTSIYKVEYKELRSLRCWRCGAESKDKLTTQIIKHDKIFECDECKTKNNIHMVVNDNLYKKTLEVV